MEPNERFLYFRTPANEDLDNPPTNDSILLPVSKITGMHAMSDSTACADHIFIYFESVANIWAAGDDEVVKSDSIKLTINQGSSFTVMEAIVSAINATGAAYQDGFIHVADDTTTTVGATSLEGDDVTRDPIYLHPDITNCGTIAIAAENS